MARTVRPLFSIFLSLAVLLVGHGLQQTLLPIYAQSLGWTAAAIGLTGSAYFAGFIVGCFCMPNLVSLVGHVRVFSVCSALAIVAILTLTQWQLLPVWILARALTGMSFAGLYMILESWLNEQVADDQRGAVLSLYGFVSLVAMSVGQLLLFEGNLVESAPLVAIIFALALIPVALTTSPQPQLPPKATLSFMSAYQASQVGVVLAAVSGFVMGMVWSNGAVYVSELTGDAEAGARFIIFTLLGGSFAQLPLGRLSDRHDRRWVMLAAGVVPCAAIFVWLMRGDGGAPGLYALGFVIGAAAMPMYSLAIAHANDNARGQFLVIATAMLVVNGVGSTVGPLIYAASKVLGYDGVFFVAVGLVFLLGVIWTAFRLVTHEAPAEYFEPFQAVPKSTQGAADLDPRNHPESAP